MNPARPPVPNDADREVSALIATLHDTELRLEELTAGEVDSVSDRTGRTMLLRSAQEHLRNIEAARQASILNALPAHIALLDARGVVVSVNEAWREFAVANELHTPGHAVGVNYLDVCDRANGDDSPEARQVARGIRSVLAGTAKSLSMEYPCHSPEVQRWFLLIVAPLSAGQPGGAVVMHVDITSEKLSEERYRMLFDASIDAVLLTAADGRILEANPSACRMFGWSEEEMLEAGLTRIVDLSDPRVAAAMEERIRTGHFTGELPFIRNGGAEFPGELSASVFTDRNGHARTTLIIRDITKRKKNDEELRRFRAAMDISGDAILLVDRASMRYIDVNQTLCDLTGYTRQELLQMTPMDMFNADRATLERDYDAIISGSDSAARLVEGKYLRKDGSVVQIETRRRALRTDSGWIIVGTARDITERKNAEAKILRLNRVYAVLSGINSAIVRIRKRGELFEEVCRIAVEEGEFALARVVELDAAGKARLAATTEADPAVFQLLLDEHNVNPERSGSVIALVLASGEAVISNNVADDLRFPNRASLTRDGDFAVALLPIFLEQRVAGLIVLRAREAGAFNPGELQLLQELTSNITLSLESIDKEDRLVRFSGGMDATADAIYLVDRASMRIVHVNDAACRTQGLTRDELLALGPGEVLALPSAELERAYDALIATGKPAVPVVLRRTRKDGSVAWLELRRHAQRSAQGWMIISVVRDITERKEAEDRIASLNRVQAVLSGINSLIVRVSDRDELFREACRVAVGAGGFRMAWIGVVDRVAMKVVPIASAGADAGFLAQIQDRFVLDGDPAHADTMAARAVRAKAPIVSNDIRVDSPFHFSKERIALGIRSIAVLPLTVSGEAEGVLVLYSTESEFFQAEELKLLIELAGDIAFAMDHIDKQARLDYLAYYDSLTGLANRGLFLERVGQYMRSAAAEGQGVAVFLIDLERFRNINESLGRPAGDALLKQVADWLVGNARNAGLVARIGADNFALVLPRVRPDGNLEHLLENWLGAFIQHRFQVGSGELRIAAKVGVARFPADGDNPDALLKNAEAALSKAQDRGERYLFYKPKMTQGAAGKVTLETQLRQALELEEFVLHYQPKINLASGKLTGAEALIRWNDPSTGLVPPGRFIPILEETGLIYDVGRWALRRAIEDYLRWRAAGLPAVRIAVNVSPLQLRNRGFVEEIRERVAVDEHAAEGLELEITESLIMEDVQHSIATLESIRALDVTIAIDDFGTGFSSLSYLAKLPVDTLKIDRSFVIGMTASPEGLSLVSTIINLAHSFKLKVVAEGVETEEQSRLLRLLGCDELQGFLFSKPVPAADFEARFLAPPAAG